MGDDKIEIKSEDNIIEIKDKNIEDLEIKGHDNVVEVNTNKKDIEIKGDDNEIKIKKPFSVPSLSFFKDKKTLNILIIILFLVLLIGGTGIRLQNLELLKDSTTGEYIPLALDPFYFLRVAETGLEYGFNNMPNFDAMRQPFEVAWHSEILPKVLVMMYKVANFFGDYSLQHIDVLYPSA